MAQDQLKTWILENLVIVQCCCLHLSGGHSQLCCVPCESRRDSPKGGGAARNIHSLEESEIKRLGRKPVQALELVRNDAEKGLTSLVPV